MYATGKWSKAMCSRCGTKIDYQDLKMEWTGLYVCPECWDKKHEQIEPITYVYDPQSLHHPYPDVDDEGEVTQQLEDIIPATTFGGRG